MTATADGTATAGFVATDEVIGKGSFATVYLALMSHSTRPSTKIAVKSIVRREQTPELLRSLQSEIKIMQMIASHSSDSSPHVLRLLSVEDSPQTIRLYTELCDMGSLHELIRRDYATGMPMTHVAHFTQHIVRALRTLHTLNICHRDIKPHNILLQSPAEHCLLPQCPVRCDADIEAYLHRQPTAVDHIEQCHMLTAKLGDFGFARIITPERPLMSTQCGSPLYMAPEILDIGSASSGGKTAGYDAKVDLWSVGVVLYEMLAGKVPFHGARNPKELSRMIKHNQDAVTFPHGMDRDALAAPVSQSMPISIPQTAAAAAASRYSGAQVDTRTSHALLHHPSEGFKDMVRALLKQNPADRMDFDTLLRHPQTRGLRILLPSSDIGAPQQQAAATATAAATAAVAVAAAATTATAVTQQQPAPSSSATRTATGQQWYQPTPSPMRAMHPRSFNNSFTMPPVSPLIPAQQALRDQTTTSRAAAPQLQVNTSIVAVAAAPELMQQPLADSEIMPFAMDALQLERRNSKPPRRRYSSRDGINGPSPLMPIADDENSRPASGSGSNSQPKHPHSASEHTVTRTTTRLLSRIVSDSLSWMMPGTEPKRSASKSSTDDDGYVVL